jgi:hypothetical protein
MCFLFLTGGAFYGIFGSTSRRSLTSLFSLVVHARGFAYLHDPDAFATDDWWAALILEHLKESLCYVVEEIARSSAADVFGDPWTGSVAT